MAVNYDEVYVQKPGGGFNRVTGEAFRALPLNERVRLILDKKIFFVRDGRVIPWMEALGTPSAAARL